MHLEATPGQLLHGLTIGAQEITCCQHCRRSFYEGDTATIFASRPADSDAWTLPRVYCDACAPTAIDHPTLGCTELLARCRLGTLADLATQQIHLAVLAPEVIATSGPATGQYTISYSRDQAPVAIDRPAFEPVPVEVRDD